MLRHLFPAHAEAIIRAARLHQVAILVRQTNIASLAYVGQPRATPKPLDCKAKTADLDVTIPGIGPKRTAGLVCDPTIVGERAYLGTKYWSARRAWDQFAPAKLPPAEVMERARRTRFITPYQYFVETDPADPHYGCVRHTTSSLTTAGKVIHGDFDLYAIIDMSAPATNIRVTERRMGEVHARSPKFMDVQIAINSRLGVPMVRHGAQETYAPEHSDEPVDVFFPDGSIAQAPDRAALQRLYAHRFEGRRLFTRTGETRILHGRWETPA